MFKEKDDREKTTEAANKARAAVSQIREAMPQKLREVIVSYKKLENLPGYSQNAYDRLAITLNELKSDTNAPFIGNRASERTERIARDCISEGKLDDKRFAQALLESADRAYRLSKEVTEGGMAHLDGLLAASEKADAKSVAELSKSIIDTDLHNSVVMKYRDLRVSEEVLQKMNLADRHIKEGDSKGAVDILGNGRISLEEHRLTLKERVRVTDQQAGGPVAVEETAAKAGAAAQGPGAEKAAKGNGDGAAAQEKAASGIEDTGEKIHRRTVLPYGLARDWLDETKDYYKVFSKWAELDRPENAPLKKRLDGMIEEVDKTSSVKSALELWREINLVWLERTTSIDNKTKVIMHDKTANIKNSRDALNVSRELLVYHIEHYSGQMLDPPWLFANGRELRDRMKAERDALESLENTRKEEEKLRKMMESAGDAERKRLEKELKGAEERAKQHIDVLEELRASTDDMLYQKVSMGKHKNSRNGLKGFYHAIEETMRTEHYLVQTGAKKDYEGNEVHWRFLYRMSMSAYKMRVLDDSVKEPAPPPGPSMSMADKPSREASGREREPEAPERKVGEAQQAQAQGKQEKKVEDVPPPSAPVISNAEQPPT